jgi:hypothetical protein
MRNGKLSILALNRRFSVFMLNFPVWINFPVTSTILRPLSKTFMKTLKKKELRLTVKEALTQVVGNFQIDKPSKRTTKLIEKTSRRLSKELKDELRKQTKKMAKAGKDHKKDESVAA